MTPSRGRAGRIAVELFVPWDAVFPALPQPQAGLLANVLFEDVDGEAGKLFAWSTQRTARAASQTWAHVDFRGGPPAGTWLTSMASPYIEPGQPYEWSLLRWGGAARVDAWLRIQAPEGGEEQTEALAIEHAANLVRARDLPGTSSPWPRARRFDVQLGAADALWRRHAVMAAPTRAGLDSSAALLAGASAEKNGFPRPEDAAVRMQQIAYAVGRLGGWYEKRHQPEGLLVSRASFWAALEPRIAEVQLLRDAQAQSDAAWVREGMQARWPRRLADGHPVGEVVLRGRRSVLDGSVQPYYVYVPTTLADAQAPLVVVLHAFKEIASQVFEAGALAQEAEDRGWIVVAPNGRGSTGYVAAGESDVLEVIEALREQLPVDGTRLYLTGYEMGGTGTWLLSLRHADLFAAASIVSGFGDMDQPGLFQKMGFHPEELFLFETRNPARLVRPGLTTAFRIVHAEADPVVSVLHARLMAERLSEFGVPHEIVVRPTAQHGRELFFETLKANLDAMAPFRRDTPGTFNPEWFGGAGGPIATVFPRGPFTVVYGTGALPAGSEPVITEVRVDLPLTGPDADARTAVQFAAEWRAHFGGEARVVRDTDVSEEVANGHNLVVIGDPRTNRLLAAARERLPVRYENDSFELAGQSFDFADAGILYAMVSPTSSDKTWLVLSAMPERLGGFEKSLLKLGADFIVTNDRHEALAVGHFRGWGNVRPQLDDTRPGTLPSQDPGSKKRRRVKPH